jgi:hypothetical protein
MTSMRPQVLYRLQAKGIIAKVATQKFKIAANGKEESFDYGTIIIPVGMQKAKGAELEQIVHEAAKVRRRGYLRHQHRPGFRRY